LRCGRQVPDLGRTADDREEHSVQVEVPEVSWNLHSVEEKGDNGNGQVQSHSDVVTLLDVGDIDARDDKGASSSGP